MRLWRGNSQLKQGFEKQNEGQLLWRGEPPADNHLALLNAINRCEAQQRNGIDEPSSAYGEAHRLAPLADAIAAGVVDRPVSPLHRRGWLGVDAAENLVGLNRGLLGSTEPIREPEELDCSRGSINTSSSA
jgi:hypothetical protein